MFGWVLAVASTVTVVPQSVRLYRTNDSSGIATPTVALATATMALWCVYTIDQADWPAFGSSVGPLVAWGVILVWLFRNRFTRQLANSTAVACACAVVAIACGVPHLAAAVGSLLWALPQAYESLTNKNLQGVSAVAFAGIAAENLGWIIYAAGTGRWAYAAAPIVQAPLAVFIASRAARASKSGLDEEAL
jgi:uncharacterized protein with PQ loop repeat